MQTSIEYKFNEDTIYLDIIWNLDVLHYTVAECDLHFMVRSHNSTCQNSKFLTITPGHYNEFETIGCIYSVWWMHT